MFCFVHHQDYLKLFLFPNINNRGGVNSPALEGLSYCQKRHRNEADGWIPAAVLLIVLRVFWRSEQKAITEN